MLDFSPSAISISTSIFSIFFSIGLSVLVHYGLDYLLIPELLSQLRRIQSRLALPASLPEGLVELPADPTLDWLKPLHLGLHLISVDQPELSQSVSASTSLVYLLKLLDPTTCRSSCSAAAPSAGLPTS